MSEIRDIIVEGNRNGGSFIEDFTISNKKAPNLGIYYFKHEDTDSDMEKMKQKYYSTTHINDDGDCILEDSSEESGGYNWNIDPEQELKPKVEDIFENRMPKRKAVSEDTIRRLVLNAEKLVSPEKTRKTDSLKNLRRRKWSNNKEEDSCDASGEDDEKESQTSEDNDDSLLDDTLRGNGEYNFTFSDLTSPERVKERPWCGSCIERLDQASSPPSINHFSISESALNNMKFPPKFLNRTSDSVNTFVNGSNSTSSTVEEIPSHLVDGTIHRRKKSKRKAKTMFGKSDPYLMYSSPKQRNYLLKSCSFPGFSYQSDIQGVSSDPQTAIPPYVYRMCDTSTTSGGDSEEEIIKKRATNFKVGHKTHYLSSEIRDDSPGKSSLNATEEQSSSLSEAWDNYQENYLSEPYSESHDSDAARRLLNFGEDYRNFIDSPSDWSAFSSDISPTFKRKQWSNQKPYEQSNLQEQYLKQLLDSKNQFKLTEEIYKKLQLNPDNSQINNEIDNILTNCEHHINVLNKLNENPAKLSLTDKAAMSGILNQWGNLKNKCLKFQELMSLQRQICEMKNCISSIELPETYSFNNTSPIEDINNEIEVCKKLLKIIHYQGEKLATLNAMVHRFCLENTDLKEHSNCKLKPDILELYELLDSTRNLITDKLHQREKLLPEWTTLENRLGQLRQDLTEDEKNLDLLDNLLNKGTFTDQTATSVRDIAKLLSETTYNQGHQISDFVMEGSFSDSGISDEGSEHEIGERQGRLAAIRRLVRQLEVRLPPNSSMRIKMHDKLIRVEEELKILQSKCRQLISKTSACSLSPQQKDTIFKSLRSKDGDGDPNSDPKGSVPWYFGRKMKATFVFHILILTVVCLSYLFHPQCCDNMNNYKWTISPKLHYEGRPPI